MARNGVTIGIPLYNEGRYIKETVLSAVTQCETLLISDNASTDNSREICESLAIEYPHIKFYIQPSNIGSVENFEFVLDKAETPYFMWLGGHDLLPENYVSTLKDALDSHKDTVLAYGAVQNISADGATIGRYDYFFSAALENSYPPTRLLSLIKYLSNCSLIHGLFRTVTIKASWSQERIRGSDHIILCNASLKGSFAYCPKTNLIRRAVHLDDTPQHQMLRVTGENPLPAHIDYAEMQKRQYQLLAENISLKSVKGLWYRLTARAYLVSRFGTFGTTIGARAFDVVLLILTVIPKRLVRFLRPLVELNTRAN